MARTHTRLDHTLRTEFFEQGQRLDADPATRELANCARCGQRIDYTVKANTTPDSHNLGHIKNVDDFPELQQDPTNFRHEHALCNQTAGKRPDSLGLGDQVADWW